MGMVVNPSRFATVGGGVGHRFWRVRCTSTQSFFGFYELQMRTSIGGDDIAPGGTAYASSTYNPSYLPANAFDGSYQTFFSAGGGTNEWLAVDFGTDVDIVEMSFLSLSIDNLPGAWSAEYSDDNTVWTAAWTGVLGTDSATKFWTTSAAANSTSYDFTTVKYRLICTATPAGGYTSFAEVRLLNSLGYPMLPVNIAASSNFTTYYPKDAFDFNLVSNWISSSPSFGEWIGFDSTRENILVGGSFYGAASTVSGEGGRAPVSFNIESSIDSGTSWQLVKAFTAIGVWSDGQQRTLSL